MQHLFTLQLLIIAGIHIILKSNIIIRYWRQCGQQFIDLQLKLHTAIYYIDRETCGIVYLQSMSKHPGSRLPTM